MKLCSFRSGGKESYGVVTGSGIVDVGPIANDGAGRDLRDALERDSLGRIRSWSTVSADRRFRAVAGHGRRDS